MATKAKQLNLRECKKLYEDHGAEVACRVIGSWVASGEVRMKDQSIREMFEAFVPDGRAVLQRLEPRRKSGGFQLREASGATDTSVFANIFGQILYTEVKEAYEGPELLWPQLCDSKQTKFLKGERIPGVGLIGDKGGVVGEGDPYPVVGPTEEYFDRGALVKSGFTTGVTREVIVEDNTGIVVERMDHGLESMKTAAEKRCLQIATGATNNYKRNGTATNTFLTSGAYVNSFTGNALYDFNSLNTIYVGMAALTDPNTGEPINFDIETILVPPALKAAAYHAQNMTQVEKVDNTSNATSVRTIGGNPYAGTIKNVLCSQYVKLATSSDTTWFGGRFKKGLRRYYAWDIETDQRENSEAKFYRDIWMEWKVSVMDMFQSYEPRYVFKSVA